MNSSHAHSNSVEAVIGFRVKSGWAATVVLTGPVQSPTVLGQGIIALSDPAVPESRQPHHAGTGALETDAAKVSRRVQIVRDCTNESVTKLLESYHSKGCKIHCAAIAVGSTVDPATITNPHIRAHALEGQLFRTALHETLTGVGLRCSEVVERRAFSEAAAALEQTEDELKRRLANLGRDQSGPWRAEQKMAALVAWKALAESANSQTR